jgi:His/Glu/Gln/Arg/opine family amino acid ABC transporter permease subunit
MEYLALLQESWPRLLKGLLMTLQLTVISLLFATFIGLIFGLMSVSKKRILRSISTFYISIFRGTPMIVQAFFIYFGIPAATGIHMSAYTAGLITLTLNAGAYISEIFRAGIQSVNKGQMEAARSLGLSHSMSMVRVILPQAIRTMIPALINQYIITLKDTSIISVIGVRELTQNGKLIIANNFRSTEIWLTVGIMYFITIYILSKIGRAVERKLSYVQSKN